MSRMKPWLIVMLASAACGGASAPSSSPMPAPAPEVAGHWTSDCVPAPDGKGYVELEFHNTAARWQLAYTAYGDAACREPLVVVEIAGPYEIGAPSARVPSAHEAVFRFDRKTVTPKVAGLVDALNGMPGCGGGFALGAARDILGTGCPGLGQRPQAACGADYDLVARAGDTLRFGERPADNDLCTPARRPTALSQLVLHRRP